MKHNYSLFRVLLAGILLAFVFSCKKDNVQSLPTLTIEAISDITSTSAIGGGDVTSDGNLTITERGICWSINPNPTTANSHVANGTGTGSFSGSITGLTPGASYNVRAYAINTIGIAYSTPVTFSALAIVPALSTLAITGVTSTTASCGGNVTYDGGTSVKARGVCWSIHQNPTISDSITINGLGLGSYTTSIKNLTPGVTYYFRAYAINTIGTAYGNQLTATTSAIIPDITTSAVLAVSSTSATSGGFLTSDGGSAITARGVCWSLNPNPTIADAKTTDGTGSSSFTSTLSGLTPGSTYYIKAYATNSIGTAYGNQLSTITTAILPTLTTTIASSITSATAKSGGNITNDGGAQITIRGICWSTSQNPTISDSKTTDGVGAGTFTDALTGLTPGTIYYIRAYATNSVGTAYGNQVIMTSLAVLPTLTTTSVLAFTSTTASSGGVITSDGGSAITSRGVCWSINQNPTIADNLTTDGTGSSSFTSSLTGLTPGAIYYIRAYATNSIGTAYGNTVTTTTTAVLPVLTTALVTSVASTTATYGGSIPNDGGAAITARGVCWSTNINPTTLNSKTTDGTGSGAFTSYITGLTPGTTYYIRAYATNSVGTIYGTQETITTLAVIPTISTTSVSAFTATTATSGGNILTDGGAAVTARGVCWSTSMNPTTSASKTSDATGIGSFASSITGLTSGTTYYIRAYATNSVGTAYGNQVTINTTVTAPVISTASVTGLTPTTASSGGSITSDGGSAVTTRGVCWATSSGPTTANAKTADGTGVGSYASSITGLTAGATYYIRAYATNGAGTSYGNEVTATTTASLASLTTNTPTNVTATTATSGGNITVDGGATVTARGVCWSTSPNPTTANSKTIDGTGTGAFTSSITGLTTGASYYVRAYATNSNGIAYGNQVTINIAAVLPTLATVTATSIMTTTATSGGNITSDGGAAVTARGVCWSTSANPTTANTKTSDGTGAGIFASSLTGLTNNTTYYLRAYATNSVGTVYGSQITVLTLPTGSLTVTDIDGNLYHTVTIGSQVWMVEDLKTTRYRNGDLIGTTSPSTLNILALNSPKYQWPYNGDEANVTYWSRLYTWYAATDSRGICPTGYHVPSDAEWTTLTTYLGGESVAGGKMKYTGTSYWLSPNTGATNSSGFSAVADGSRDYDGTFTGLEYVGDWWSSTEYSSSDGYYRCLYDLQIYITRTSYTKDAGMAIRCVRD
jgi:uncharacterized protein (TIGR02145 family)